MRTRQAYRLWIVAVACACASGGAARGQDKQAGDAAQVPLKRVVLFSSGVGFFERRAEVEGNASVDLRFDAGDINDLLKSMVVEDTGGGRIDAVSYGSRDPLTRTLRTFSIDLPISANDLPQRPEGDELKQIEKPLTLLLIDDDPECLNLINQHLRDENYQVLSADSGKKGIQFAKTIFPE